jgi:hypothetical protein
MCVPSVASGLEKVLGAPRGAGETKAVGAWRRYPARQLVEVRDQAVAISAYFCELALERATLFERHAFEVCAQPGVQCVEVLGDTFDEIGVLEELALDLFDRVAVRHQ